MENEQHSTIFVGFHQFICPFFIFLQFSIVRKLNMENQILQFQSFVMYGHGIWIPVNGKLC
jgi:hypothetical protein